MQVNFWRFGEERRDLSTLRREEAEFGAEKHYYWTVMAINSAGTPGAPIAMTKYCTPSSM
jgi:hypothetical protein